MTTKLSAHEAVGHPCPFCRTIGSTFCTLHIVLSEENMAMLQRNIKRLCAKRDKEQGHE